MNLDSKKWDDPNYNLEKMANLVKEFLLEEDCHQLIDEYTRIRDVNGVLQRSCLDHVTVNCVNKIIKGPYKIGRQFARTLFERVEWVGGAEE